MLDVKLSWIKIPLITEHILVWDFKSSLGKDRHIGINKK